MTDPNNCSECGEPMPPRGGAATGTGSPTGEISFQPTIAHEDCPKCGASLWRNTEESGNPWRRSEGGPSGTE